MRRLALLALLTLLVLPGQAESLEDGLNRALDMVDVPALEQASGQTGLGELLLRLARGETVWDAAATAEAFKELAAGEIKASLSRVLGLMAPALLCALAGGLRPGSSVARMAENACFLVLAAVLTADLRVYLLEADGTVSRAAQLMQTLFPMLLTLLAAVGATSGAALFQPAVTAASGTMTALVRGVSLQLALGVAVVTLLDHLSPRMRLSRLAALLRSVSSWTLGAAFTVFIGVTAMQGLTAAAADGIGIRAAKYAVDNLVPVVGGMFADTMDTLVGCAMLIKNALGVTGLFLLLSVVGAPMLRVLGAVLIYRLCAALLQPAVPDRVSAMIHDFSDVMMLLFIIELSVGAMFMLLVAQMLAVGNLTVGLR
ncbi:MAG: stage III sporulation protein AE [Clostridia bacterium]|nr:stage III sporulation protein AE [Clostridia bacterium]